GPCEPTRDAGHRLRGSDKPRPAHGAWAVPGPRPRPRAAPSRTAGADRRTESDSSSDHGRSERRLSRQPAVLADEHDVTDALTERKPGREQRFAAPSPAYVLTGGR